jgi:hypothetical protein
VDTTKQHESFERVCREESPSLDDGLAWLALSPGDQLERVRAFNRAVRDGDTAVEPYPELQSWFKPDFQPRLSRGLLALIDAALGSNSLASRDGYAHDLGVMSRFSRGPESPIGWVPFACIIGRRSRALITGMQFEGPRQFITFALLSEVLTAR